MAILYWVKWKSCIFKLASSTPDQGFDEMEDMFRCSGDMPRRVFYKPPQTEAEKPFGKYYVELESLSNMPWLSKQIFPRWNSFGAWTKFVDYINISPQLKKYRYNKSDTKALFDKLLSENNMGMYADW
jgi:hypothetical protein